jgi:hypothetical protein
MGMLEEVKKAQAEMAQIAFDLGTFHGKLVADMEVLRQRVEVLEDAFKVIDERIDVIMEKVEGFGRRMA